MEDSIDLEMLDYDGWSDLEEEEVSARKRRRYSPVRDEGGHTTGIELVTVENDPEALAPPSSSPAVLTPERSSESSTLTSLPSTLTPTPGSPAPCQSIVTLASSTTTVITSLPPPCTVKSSSSSPVVTVTRLTTSGNTTGALLTAVAQTPPVAALASLPPSGSAALTPLPCADAVSVPSPLSSAVGCAVNSRSTCLAQGCKVQGTLEGLMTHWNEIHEVERVLRLCPLTGCNLKFGHVNQVEVHLRRRHHISRPGVRRLLNEVPPLADFVANKKYQYPGVSRPPYFAAPEVPHGALGHLLKGTVQGQVETIVQNAKAVSLPGPQSLAMPRQVLPLPVNMPSAGTPWRMPLPPPTTSGPRLLPPLATSGPRMLPPLASSDPRMLLPQATSGPRRMLPPAISGPRVPRGPPPAISDPRMLPPATTGPGLLPPVMTDCGPRVPQGPALAVTERPLHGAATPATATTLGNAPDCLNESRMPDRRVVLSELRPAPESHAKSCRPSIGAKPADDPLSSHTQRAQVRSLDGTIEELLKQRREATEGAFGAMKREYEKKAEECRVLKRRVTFLESEMRGFEKDSHYVPRPTIVGHLQSIGSTRAHLLLPNLGHTAVFPMTASDLALLNVNDRDQAISCDPL